MKWNRCHSVSISDIVNATPIADLDGYWVDMDGSVYSEFSGGQPRILPDGSRERQRHPNGNVHRLRCPAAGPGYRMFAANSNGVRIGLLVHRVVLEAFVGPCPEGMQCRHLDGDKSNCKLSNLAWGTPLENSDDKFLHGTVQLGEDHHGCKFSDEMVSSVAEMLRKGVLHKDIAEIFGVSKSWVSAVSTGRIRSQAADLHPELERNLIHVDCTPASAAGYQDAPAADEVCAASAER